MKKISMALAICVIILGVILIVTSFTGPELPRVVTYIFWALVILNGVFLSIVAKKKE